MKGYYVIHSHWYGEYAGPFLSRTVAQSFIDLRLEDLRNSEDIANGRAKLPKLTLREEYIDLTVLGFQDGLYADLGHQIYM